MERVCFDITKEQYIKLQAQFLMEKGRDNWMYGAIETLDMEYDNPDSCPEKREMYLKLQQGLKLELKEIEMYNK